MENIVAKKLWGKFYCGNGLWQKGKRAILEKRISGKVWGVGSGCPALKR